MPVQLLLYIPLCYAFLHGLIGFSLYITHRSTNYYLPDPYQHNIVQLLLLLIAGIGSGFIISIS
ncbi:hypothetical protein J2T02_004822 [Chitinophaga terrae (ex Kim and Jung 2007)]|uniref:hypothetical protein n=1 Tax=Chitinophaga terrae (ex Kim and Jung 2007) TaxID=408074 RepID=UPI0027894AA5|nr:hypothetical protein [Chitinophaga terrae (ex Kim and Jung 2007)]MDQ0109678.1 hypothetical protein [Chitinophaga terrae (ex Kim and Jung 2007)]